MDSPSARYLKIYLDDHLALMAGEAELVKRCLTSQPDPSAARITLEGIVESLATEIGHARRLRQSLGGLVNPIGSWLAWGGEKLGRLKLNGSLVRRSELSTLVELEALVAAAEVRVGFWQHLEEILAPDGRPLFTGCGAMRSQAIGHRDTLASHRREAARRVFSSQPVHP